jgi:hypothetical protein
MNALPPERIRRYRRLHRAFWLVPICLAITAWAVNTLAPQLVERWPLEFGLAGLIVLVFPIVAVTLLQMRVIRVVNPDPGLRKQTLRTAWLGPNPFGYIWAFHALLRASEALYAEQHAGSAAHRPPDFKFEPQHRR